MPQTPLAMSISRTHSCRYSSSDRMNSHLGQAPTKEARLQCIFIPLQSTRSCNASNATSRAPRSNRGTPMTQIPSSQRTWYPGYWKPSLATAETLACTSTCKALKHSGSSCIHHYAPLHQTPSHTTAPSPTVSPRQPATNGNQTGHPRRTNERGPPKSPQRLTLQNPSLNSRATLSAKYHPRFPHCKLPLPDTSRLTQHPHASRRRSGYT